MRLWVKDVLWCHVRLPPHHDANTGLASAERNDYSGVALSAARRESGARKRALVR